MSLFYEVLYWIITNCLYLVDSIMEVFEILSGLSTVAVQGSDSEVVLLEYVITNATVQKVFFCVAGLSMFVAFVFTMIAICKNMVITNKKTVGKTTFQFLMTSFSVLITIYALFGFIYLANEILQIIDLSFNVTADDRNLTLGQQIMEICNGNKQIQWNDQGVNEISFKEMFGFKGTSWGIFYNLESGEGGYADFSTFNFLLGTLASIGLIIVLVQAALSLTMRIFNIVFLYIAAPLCIATVPLDNGARFKLWRETTISKILLAYGNVIAVNVYILLLPILTKLSISDKGTLVNMIFQTVLIVCGAMTIPGGQLLFARLFGTQAEENREALSGFRSMASTVIGGGHAVASLGRGIFGGTNRYNKHTSGILGGAAKAAGGAVNLGGSLLGGNAYRSTMSKVKTGASNLKNTLKGNFGKINPQAQQSQGNFMSNGGLVGSLKSLNNIRKNGLDIEL